MKKGKSLIAIIPFLVMTFIMVLSLAGLEISVEFDSLLPETSEAILNMQRMEESFGESREMLLIIRTEDVFDADTSAMVFSFVNRLKEFDGVVSVRSIFDAAKLSYMGSLETEPYFTDGVPGDSVRELLDNPLYVGNLVDKRGTTLFVPILLEDNASIGSIVDMAERELAGFEVFSTGEPVIWDEMNRAIITLVIVYPPILFGIVWFIYYLKIKNRFAAVIPVIIALIATLWTYGIANWAGFEINILTSTVGLFIVIICSAYGLHFLDRFMYNSVHNEREEAIRITLKEEVTPITLSAGTTIAGFMTFTFGTIEGFSDLGILVSIGIALSAFFTLTVLPRLLKLVNIRNGKEQRGRWSSRLFISRRLQRSSWFIVIAALVVSPFLLQSIEVNFDQLEYFKKGSSVLRSASVAREEMGWVLPFYIVLEKDGVFTASEERQMKELSDRVVELPDVSGVSSILDVTEGFGVPLPLIHIASRGTEIPLEDFLSNDSTRILVKTTRTDAVGVGELRDSVEGILEDYQSLNSYIASPALTTTEMNNEILTNQIRTIVAAMTVFLILLAVVFRSFLTSVVAVAPIALTVLMNFVYMSLFGIRLDIATAIVAGVLMGLTIDYSIHLVTRYRQKKDVDTATVEISPVIVASAVGLAAGFGTLFFAPMTLFVRLGLLLSAGMLTGAFLTLTLLPSLLRVLSKKQLKKGKEAGS